MSRLNYKKLLADWDTIILRLCEDVTAHDVLGVVLHHLELAKQDHKRAKRPTKSIDECMGHVKKAMTAINPEA